MIRKTISFTISKLRREPFVLDNHVPLGYMLRLLVSKAVQLAYGMMVMRRCKCFVSPSATILCPKKIKTHGFLMVASYVEIDALSTEGVSFGNGVSIGEGTWVKCTGSLRTIGKGIKVGNNVGMGERCHYGCAGGIEIGDNTIVGIYVTMHSENHVFSDTTQPIRSQGVTHQGIKVGSNCWIGAKVTILDGAVIGNGCVVAAGAVVRGVFPDNCVIGGVPAKILKHRTL